MAPPDAALPLQRLVGTYSEAKVLIVMDAVLSRLSNEVAWWSVEDNEASLFSTLEVHDDDYIIRNPTVLIGL